MSGDDSDENFSLTSCERERGADVIVCCHQLLHGFVTC